MIKIIIATAKNYYILKIRFYQCNKDTFKILKEMKRNCKAFQNFQNEI